MQPVRKTKKHDLFLVNFFEIPFWKKLISELQILSSTVSAFQEMRKI